MYYKEYTEDQKAAYKQAIFDYYDFQKAFKHMDNKTKFEVFMGYFTIPSLSKQDLYEATVIYRKHIDRKKERIIKERKKKHRDIINLIEKSEIDLDEIIHVLEELKAKKAGGSIYEHTKL